jgi:oligopeptide/dipeptide ABC transporter ATP-binding protein
MDKILEVKNLQISFRTNSGTVKAVRDISFDLERGKTLAIVGESGSGKSVTSKAILGILAGNSIIDGGEILYDGMDLLKLSEEEMHPLRGDKISMIFQDPLSSLNPIVKIGKQITEATLLKNKTNRKNARNQFNGTLALLEKEIAASGAASAEKAKELCKSFDSFCIEANKLEYSYNNDAASVESAVARLEDFLFRAEKNQKQNVRAVVSDVMKHVNSLKDPFFMNLYKGLLAEEKKKVNDAFSGYRQSKTDNHLPAKQEEALRGLEKLLKEMENQARPDFFRIGFYKMKNPGADIYAVPVTELNEQALEVLDREFMKEFLGLIASALKHSNAEALEKKKKAISSLKEALAFYQGSYTKSDAQKQAKTVCAAVKEGIDPLEIHKDNRAYTFETSLNDALNKYFHYQVQNPKEEERFAKQTAKREALVAKGKTVDWKVVPKNVMDLDLLKSNVEAVVSAMLSHYEEAASEFSDIDFDARSVDLIDFFKDRASRAVYIVTKAMAKEKAIRLMEEVGISEPRMRYYQYPFEFSGGMRQRIVIAIALTADPEILICDEPTTALDVTIQAQILELINKLKKERNLSIIFITHDLGVVANMADDIAVMYAGKIVEYGTANEIFYDPRHPYTWALLSSMPDLDTRDTLDAIPGTPPNMIYPPVGDAFAERNKYAMKIDFEKQPPMFPITETHSAATWLLHPDAPKVEIPEGIRNRIARMRQKNAAKNGGVAGNG